MAEPADDQTAIAPSAPAPVARLRGLTHRYGDVTALDALDLELPAGRIVGLIGPDGVGKSTLLALIAGVRRIQHGTVEVLGGDIAQASHRAAVCPRIAYMPQGLGRNLYPTLTVAENVDFFGRLFGQDAVERATRIGELLDATDLGAFAGRAAGKLSGGMKQKLALCCALIHDPDLLILDEPTTGVDPLSRRQFWELIARIRLRRPGMSVLVATAYMEEADRFDRILAMDGGRVLAAGSPAELRALTASADLERAFVALLPEARRARHAPLVIPPRAVIDGTAIEADGLTRRFGDFVAVDHVSFRIERGEIFGFLGSNGCGKTTTMKMLTGLLPASSGNAALFGRAVDAGNLETRKRIGYMSQAFSLYTELSVRQNLTLHARLFELPADHIDARVAEMLQRFDLAAVADAQPDRLPLGMRQRLSLAVAVIHRPEILILDEPTSGVDPVARDEFWRLLIELSRRDGVTIFLSTHFMNEAERCDRISLMHAGRVLMAGAPADLVRAHGAASLEEVFVAALQTAAAPATRNDDAVRRGAGDDTSGATGQPTPSRRTSFDVRRAWAVGRREAIEILRDPIRLAFALLGPMFLMLVFGFGISFDVERLRYAVLDLDGSPESRAYLEGFSSSRYFAQGPPVADHADLDRRLTAGRLTLAIEIPPDFGRDLRRGRPPTIGVWVDGAMPFRAETARGYAMGVHRTNLAELAARSTAAPAGAPATTATVETRFRYNQSFRSAIAIVPGVVMLLLVLIPAMMTAVGVVREKEMGSITNLYAAPLTRLEFVLGKQLPYVALATVAFVGLLLQALYVFGLRLAGDPVVLALGALLYVVATTGLGLVISMFVRTQIAAIFTTAIISVTPAVNFSGLLTPVASLTGGATLMGRTFPSSYFQPISVGVFTKGLGFAELAPSLLALSVFVAVFLIAGTLLLRTQEP